jgi:rubrerythrin
MQVADPKNFLHISSVDDMLMAAFQGKKQQSLTYEIASHRATQEKIIPLARLFNDMGNGRLFSLNHLHGCVVWIQEDSIHSKTLKESLTWDALIQAFASECQDNRRCGFYAQKAREKSRKICADTLEAQAEIHHNNALHLLSVISLIEDPVTHLPLGDTLLNLKSAQAGEIYEYTAMYPEMAKKAYEENLDVIADWLDILSRAELVHANGFGKCLRSLGVENAQSLSEQSLKEASFYLETKRYQESSYETLLE